MNSFIRLTYTCDDCNRLFYYEVKPKEIKNEGSSIIVVCPKCDAAYEMQYWVEGRKYKQIKEGVDIDDPKKVWYRGTITMHYEQGCGHFPQFHDDRGLHGDKKQYWDWDWTINFNKRTKIDLMIIKTKDGSDGEVLYKGPWSWSREHSFKSPMYIPCPKQMEPKKWLDILHRDLRCVILTEEIVPGLQKEREEKQNG